VQEEDWALASGYAVHMLTGQELVVCVTWHDRQPPVCIGPPGVGSRSPRWLP
jgi:hypothetical protein